RSGTTHEHIDERISSECITSLPAEDILYGSVGAQLQVEVRTDHLGRRDIIGKIDINREAGGVREIESIYAAFDVIHLVDRVRSRGEVRVKDISVIAALTRHGVIASEAGEAIVETVAGEGVIVAAANDVLDAVTGDEAQLQIAIDDLILAFS